MKEILEPLALIPGVRMAALISEDGVPITTTAGAHRKRDADEPQQPIDRDEQLNGFTALAASWVDDMRRAVGQLAWAAPRRMVLRATMGELVLQQAPNAVVLVVLERGVTAEELRVPIDGAIARMQRVLRSLGQRRESPPPLPVQAQPPGPFPAAAENNAPVTPETLADNTLGDH